MLYKNELMCCPSIAFKAMFPYFFIDIFFLHKKFWGYSLPYGFVTTFS